jgi:hypothetical protein
MKRKCLVFLFLITSVFSSAASEVPSDAIKHCIDFARHALTLFPIGTVMWDNYKVAYRKADVFIPDIYGREIKRELYLYNAVQRKEAKIRCDGAFFGLVAALSSNPVLDLPVTRFKSFFHFRKEQSIFVALEQSLLPAACYVASKKIIDRFAPDLDNKMSIPVALISSLCLAYCITRYSGASPERLALTTLLFHYSGDAKNKYMSNRPLLRHVTSSLDYGFTVMPIIQMTIGRWYQKSSMLTICPTMYQQLGGVNRSAEFMHTMIPVGVLAGVDVIFNAVAVTRVGTAIGSVVDAGLEKAIQPLPKHMRRPAFRRFSKQFKEGSFEAAKIMTAVTIIGALEIYGLKPF